MSKCAMITGVYGQDGSLLAEHLLTLGYRVVGLVQRRKPDFPTLAQVEIIETDIADPVAMRNVFQEIRPDECYHLAAYHHSSDQHSSEEGRWQMLKVNFMATQALLDALLEATPSCRFLYAGSSQMYTPRDDVTEIDEHTPYSPATYYGITKVASAQLIDLYRRDRALWGVTAILFNHESTRRGKSFLSRKVTSSAAAYANKSLAADEKLSLRDMSARTDWSAATDFVYAMHLALQGPSPQDYVLASGTVHTVGELVQQAFGSAGLDWQDFVATAAQPAGSRPCLRGNPARAQSQLGWKPEKSFVQLIEEMVAHDQQCLHPDVAA